MSEPISLDTVSEGMANPSPCEPFTMAVVSPIICPLALKSGPPELPGLMGALNWITSAIEKLPAVTSVIVLPSWLTTPTVSEPDRPNGLPIAATGFPTLTELDDESVSGWNSEAGAVGTLTIARSLYGSVPTTEAGYASPFQKMTVMLVAPSTTWKFVTM